VIRAIGADSELGACRSVHETWSRDPKSPKDVAPVLTRSKKATPSTTGYLTMGGADEAAHYVEEWGFDWLTTPGAIDWLTKIAAENVPTRSKSVPGGR
jgi:hypothetical protein